MGRHRASHRFMTATFAPSPWSAPAVAARTAWRFGRRLEDSAVQGMQWVMKRNCSITPRDMMIVYLSLCAVSLAIAGGFWWVGAPTVMAFAGLELVLLGVALAVYARHATDCETITLAGRELAIEHRCGIGVGARDFAPNGCAWSPPVATARWSRCPARASARAWGATCAPNGAPSSRRSCVWRCACATDTVSPASIPTIDEA